MKELQVLNDSENSENVLQSKKSDYEQGNETGYVTDSSLNSRQGSQKKSDLRQDRAYVNRRKTKSERDKKRKGSLPDAYRNDSESETSDDTHNNQKYRRRASCKRNELDKENTDQRQSRGSRRGSAQLICNAAQDLPEETPTKVETRPYKGRQRRDSRINSFVVFNFAVEQNQHVDDSQAEEKPEETTHQSIEVSRSPEIERVKIEKKLDADASSKQIVLSTFQNESNDVTRQQKGLRPDSYTRANVLSYTEDDENGRPSNGKESRPSSTTTLKMNLKDIYSGTWDAKEKAVFNLVLQNMDSTPKEDSKKQLINKSINKFKSKTQYRTTSMKEENMYSIHEYMNPPASAETHQKQDKKSRSGIFSGFKWIRNALKRSNDKKSKVSEMDYVFPKDPLLDAFITPKKKSIFKRFRKKKDIESMRRRAQSTNSHYSVEYLLNAADQSQNTMTHGSLATLTSAKNMFKKTKSQDHLNGAFEFFANQTHVFQRTASVSRKAKSRHASCEHLDVPKRRNSQSSINHVFEAVQKRDERDNKLVYADAKVASTKKAMQHSISRKKYDYVFDDNDAYSPPSQSVPNYSYMSPDACCQVTMPFPEDLNNDNKHYSTRGTFDSGFGTAFSNKSSESGFGTGKNISRNNKQLPEYNGRVCVTVHEEARTDDLLLNSFHQRRPKKQYNYEFV